MALSKKIDFAVIFSVKNANPNGDPLNGNRPRTTYEGLGEVSDVCLKRKIRDRLQENGHAIFVQSDDRKNDDFLNLRARAVSVLGENMNASDSFNKACETWLDVRAFGNLFAYASKNTSSKNNKSKKDKSDDDKKDDDSGISIAIRGPVSIHSAFTPAPVSVTSTQITKSVSGDAKKVKKGKGSDEEEEWREGEKSSDTMGMKHRVDSGFYIFYGSMNPQLSIKTGFSDQDAAAIKAVLPRLFENDASSARPEGSMRVEKVYWWEHSCPAGQYSSAKVHGSITLNPDGSCTEKTLENLTPEIIPGF